MELGADATLGEVFLEAEYHQQVGQGQDGLPSTGAPPAGHHFAAWLRDELRRQGLLARSLAHRVGVTEGIVSRWLSGKARPRLALCWKIAAALEVEVEVVQAQAGYQVPRSNPAQQAAATRAGEAAAGVPPAGHGFGLWLRDELGRRGIPVGHFASCVGVAEDTVYQWLRGKSRPRAVMYWKIAAALDLKVEEVLAQAAYDVPSSNRVQ